MERNTEENKKILEDSVLKNKSDYGTKRKMFNAGLDVECIHHGFHKNWYKSSNSDNIACRYCQFNRAKKYNNNPKNTFKMFHKWARRRNREFCITEDYLKYLFEAQSEKCAISGMELNRSNMSLDRINSEIGYIEGNLQWVHNKINRMKSNIDESEFIYMCSTIANYQILKEALSSAKVKKK